MIKKMILLTFTLVMAGSTAMQMTQGQTDNPVTYYNSGLQKSNRGQYKAAILDFDKAIRIKPDYGKAYIGRGMAKDALGQHLEAITDYDKAIGLDVAEDILAYYKRGIAKYKTGQYIQAISDLDVVIRRKPDFANAYYNRGLAKSTLSQYEDVISDFDKAIQLKPVFFEAYYNRGLTYYKIGKMHSAISSFDMALVIKPDDTDAQNNRTMAVAAHKATGTCDNLDLPPTKVTPTWINEAPGGQDSDPKGVWLQKHNLWNRNVTVSPKDDDDGPLVLTVKFLNGTQEEKDDVEKIAPTWEEFAYIKFVFLQPSDPGASDIRINFEGIHGYNSVLGLGNTNIPPEKQTMNLCFGASGVYEAEDEEWKKNEIRRKILHEFGHALGLHHEHMHPELTLDWNYGPNGVYDYYEATNGWDKKKVDDNVIKRLDPDVYNFSDFDTDSIMAYVTKAERKLPILRNKETGKEIKLVGKTTEEIQAEIERIEKAGGELESDEKTYKILNTPFEIKQNTMLSPGDQAAAARMYPGRSGHPTKSGNGFKTEVLTFAIKGARNLFGSQRNWTKTVNLPKGKLLDVRIGGTLHSVLWAHSSVKSVRLNEEESTLTFKGVVEDGLVVNADVSIRIEIDYYPATR